MIAHAQTASTSAHGQIAIERGREIIGAVGSAMAVERGVRRLNAVAFFILGAESCDKLTDVAVDAQRGCTAGAVDEAEIRNYNHVRHVLSDAKKLPAMLAAILHSHLPKMPRSFFPQSCRYGTARNVHYAAGQGRQR
jgi:hypothetical protein